MTYLRLLAIGSLVWCACCAQGFSQLSADSGNRAQAGTPLSRFPSPGDSQTATTSPVRRPQPPSSTAEAATTPGTRFSASDTLGGGLPEQAGARQTDSAIGQAREQASSQSPRQERNQQDGDNSVQKKLPDSIARWVSASEQTISSFESIASGASRQQRGDASLSLAGQPTQSAGDTSDSPPSFGDLGLTDDATRLGSGNAQAQNTIQTPETMPDWLTPVAPVEGGSEPPALPPGIGDGNEAAAAAEAPLPASDRFNVQLQPQGSEQTSTLPSALNREHGRKDRTSRNIGMGAIGDIGGAPRAARAARFGDNTLTPQRENAASPRRASARFPEFDAAAATSLPHNGESAGATSTRAAGGQAPNVDRGTLPSRPEGRLFLTGPRDSATAENPATPPARAREFVVPPLGGRGDATPPRARPELAKTPRSAADSAQLLPPQTSTVEPPVSAPARPAQPAPAGPLANQPSPSRPARDSSSQQYLDSIPPSNTAAQLARQRQNHQPQQQQLPSHHRGAQPVVQRPSQVAARQHHDPEDVQILGVTHGVSSRVERAVHDDPRGARPVAGRLRLAQADMDPNRAGSGGRGTQGIGTHETVVGRGGGAFRTDYLGNPMTGAPGQALRGNETAGAAAGGVTDQAGANGAAGRGAGGLGAGGGAAGADGDTLGPLDPNGQAAPGTAAKGAHPWLWAALFLSIGANVYLVWIAWDHHGRFQDLLEDMAEGQQKSQRLQRRMRPELRAESRPESRPARRADTAHVS